MTELRVHDTLARQKRAFEPRDPARVTMYVCGPTVYGHAHIGNARPAVVFDVLFRVLRRLYGERAVVYARNVTDVDDKINAKAAAEGVAIGEITGRYETIYLQDMAALNVIPPTLQPHVTDNMEAITGQIGALIARGAAYAAEGHVLFDVASFPDYGRLSGRSLDDMIAGARVEVAPYKRNPHDFVLWKPSKPGEPAWPSPWGEGRPGWHIECSAMIEKELGFPIDIHGGGHDLIFPHHENEIAQGRCAHATAGEGAEFSRYWMHNGFLTMDAEKMSKSLGNVLLLSDLVDRYPGEVVRWALLSAHYRQPLDWTDALLEQARKNLDYLYGVLRRAQSVEAEAGEAPAAFVEALHDDLNTPRAISELLALGAALETAESGGARRAAKGALLAAAGLIGVLSSDPDVWFEAGIDDDLRDRVEALLAARKDARATRNWAEADRIRAELTALGVEVMDGPSGATWRMRDGG